MGEKQDLLQSERDVGRRTRAENPTEVSLCQSCFHHLVSGFNLLERPLVWEEPKDTILLLATMGHNSLRWAWELLLKGYYTQANALSRAGWECWLHGAYLLLYPESLDEWRDFKKRPRPWRMRELVSERAGQSKGVDADEFRAGMGQMYFGYNEYAHPTDRALRVLVETKDAERRLRLGCAYDGVLVYEATNLFCSATMLTFTLFYSLMPENLQYRERGDALRAEVAGWRAQLKA